MIRHSHSEGKGGKEIKLQAQHQNKINKSKWPNILKLGRMTTGAALFYTIIFIQCFNYRSSLTDQQIWGF